MEKKMLENLSDANRKKMARFFIATYHKDIKKLKKRIKKKEQEIIELRRIRDEKKEN